MRQQWLLKSQLVDSSNQHSVTGSFGLERSTTTGNIESSLVVGNLRDHLVQVPEDFHITRKILCVNIISFF